MSDEDDHKRTVVYADSAISYIKRNTLPAHPRSYELWYTYCAGYNHGLNRAINDVLKQKRRVTSTEMETIYGQFLSPTKLGDQLDNVGDQVFQEVEGLVDSLQLSADATSDYGDILESAGEKLKKLDNAANLQAVIKHLVNSTRNAMSSNQALESQLLESKRQIENLKDKLETIRYESLTDELTTLHNRKHFDASIERMISQAEHDNSGIALLMTDIDHFKKFNDTFGHQTGDQVLRLVALATKQNVKNEDVPCRYGGEEFAILLPGTDLQSAKAIAEKIRLAVQAKELVKRSTGENLGKVTVSIGIAIQQPGDNSHTLISRADEAMYLAKRSGRNMVKTEVDLLAGAA